MVILKNIIHFCIAASMKKYKATLENEFLLPFAFIKPCKNGGCITTDVPLPPYTYRFPWLMALFCLGNPFTQSGNHKQQL